MALNPYQTKQTNKQTLKLIFRPDTRVRNKGQCEMKLKEKNLAEKSSCCLFELTRYQGKVI